MAFPLDVETRTEAITSAIERLISRGGISAITTRAIAEEVGLSVGTLGSRQTSKQRLLRRCASTAARRWTAEVEVRVRYGDPAGFLPLDQRRVWQVRAWLGWSELARCDDVMAAAAQSADISERALLRQVFAGEDDVDLWDDEAVELLWACLQGIRETLRWDQDGGDLRIARERWSRACQGVRAASATSRSERTIASGSSAE